MVSAVPTIRLPVSYNLLDCKFDGQILGLVTFNIGNEMTRSFFNFSFEPFNFKEHYRIQLVIIKISLICYKLHAII